MIPANRAPDHREPAVPYSVPENAKESVGLLEKLLRTVKGIFATLPEQDSEITIAQRVAANAIGGATRTVQDRIDRNAATAREKWCRNPNEKTTEDYVESLSHSLLVSILLKKVFPWFLYDYHYADITDKQALDDYAINQKNKINQALASNVLDINELKRLQDIILKTERTLLRIVTNDDMPSLQCLDICKLAITGLIEVHQGKISQNNCFNRNVPSYYKDYSSGNIWALEEINKWADKYLEQFDGDTIQRHPQLVSLYSWVDGSERFVESIKPRDLRDESTRRRPSLPPQIRQGYQSQSADSAGVSRKAPD